MMPSQVYKPVNFNREVDRIFSNCKLINRSGKVVFIDPENNEFIIDYENQLIEVN